MRKLLRNCATSVAAKRGLASGGPDAEEPLVRSAHCLARGALARVRLLADAGLTAAGYGVSESALIYTS